MNISGLSELDIQEIAELEDMERQLTELAPTLPKELVAKALISLSHDWLRDLYLEDKCMLLILKAEKICPNYCRDIMPIHMKEDPEFNKIGISLGQQLIITALSLARDNK